MTILRRLRARISTVARLSPLHVGLMLLQAIAAVGVLAMVVKEEGLQLPLLSGPRYIVTADFANGDGLDPSKKPPVTVAGVPMGSVSDVRFTHGMAVATLDLSEQASGRIFRNATVLITPRSAINDLTVDISPGTPSAGPLGSSPTIPESRTASATNLDRLTDVLNLDVRSQLVVLVDELGIGLHGRSRSLDEAIAELRPFLGDSETLARQLSLRQRMLSRLVSNLSIVFTTLGQRGQQLRQVIDAGRTTLGTVAVHQADVEDTLRNVSPALTNLNSALASLNTLAGPLAPALEQLRPVARALPAALTSLRHFVPSGSALIDDLRALDSGGGAGARWLAALLRRLGPASTALEPSAQQLLPVVKALDRHPAGIGDLGSNYTGIFSGQNANGPTLRAFGFFEPIHPEDFGLPAGTSGAPLNRLDTSVASALTHVCKTQNLLACLALSLTPGLHAIRSGGAH